LTVTDPCIIGHGFKLVQRAHITDGPPEDDPCNVSPLLLVTV
jgi:hypothetical protein